MSQFIFSEMRDIILVVLYLSHWGLNIAPIHLLGCNIELP